MYITHLAGLTGFALALARGVDRRGEGRGEGVGFVLVGRDGGGGREDAAPLRVGSTVDVLGGGPVWDVELGDAGGGGAGGGAGCWVVSAGWRVVVS